jgi:hypothetical protein
VQAYEQATEDGEQFVQNLAMFLTTFLREHLLLIEGAEHLRQTLKMAMSYLIKISYVRNTGELHSSNDYRTLRLGCSLVVACVISCVWLYTSSLLSSSRNRWPNHHVAIPYPPH